MANNSPFVFTREKTPFDVTFSQNDRILSKTDTPANFPFIVMGLETISNPLLMAGKVIINPEPLCLKESRYIENLESTLNIQNKTANYIGFKAPDTLSTNTSYTLPSSGTSGQYLTWTAGDILTWTSIVSLGDVVGPPSATNNALVRFDTATGKLIQNSVGILSDLGSLSSLTGLESTGAIDFDSVSSFDLLSTGQANIESSQAAADAIHIHSSNPVGGILLDAAAGVRFHEADISGIILDDSTSLFDTTIKCSSLNSENHTITLPPAFATVNGQVLSSTTGGITSWIAQSAADVVGPPSATNNALVRFDTATGKLIQNSVGILSDLGSLSSLTGLESTGAIDFDSVSSFDLLSTAQTNIESSQAAADAIHIHSSNPVGGILLDAAAGVRFHEADISGIILDDSTSLFDTVLKCSSLNSETHTITLPPAFPTVNGQVLSSTTGGITSWIAQSAGDVTASLNMTDNTIIIGDGGGKGIQDSAITITNDDELGGVSFITLNTHATKCTWYGGGALASLTTAQDCTAFGNLALNAVTTGIVQNSAFGESALKLSTGVRNTAVGSFCLANHDTGNNNTAIGRQAMYASTAVADCTIIGAGAGGELTTGSDGATAVGIAALLNTTTAARATAIGYYAGDSAVTSADTTYVGYKSGEFYAGGENTALGSYSLRASSSVTGDHNLGLGYNSGSALDGTDSNNILIDSVGVSGDNDTIRIGETQTSAFIKGIHGITPAVASTEMVIINSNDELGSQALPAANSDYPPGYLDGGGIEWVSNSTVNVMPVSCRDTGDSYNIVLGANALLNMAVTGSAGGLQIAESSDQMYKVYVIADSNNINATSTWGVPQGTAISLPGTHDKFRFMGHIKNNASSNILHFQMFNKGRSRMYHYHESRSDLEVYNGAGTAGVFVNLDLDLLVPLEVDTCDFSVELDMDADTHKFYMQSGLNPQSVSNSLVVYGSGIQAADFGFSDFTVYNQAIDRSGGTLGVPSVEWSTDAVGQDVTISVSSYIQNL